MESMAKECAADKRLTTHGSEMYYNVPSGYK